MMKRMMVGAVLVVSAVALAQSPGAVKDGKVVKSARDEIAKLQRDLDAQRALLLKVLELQQQQYTALVKLVKGEISAAEAVVAVPAPIERKTVEEPAAPTPPEPAPRSAAARPNAKPVGTVKGKVTLKGGAGPAWVFIEDISGSSSERSLEIKQEDKQFNPRLAAVPRGSKLLFANYDSIFHNVFSVSRGNNFDLGNTRSGDAAKAYVAANPGVVEIFCNMHAKMSSTVLVTPGPYLARVQADGSFRLEDVPVGTHKIAAWAGGAVASKSVEISTSGAEANLEVVVGESGSAHKNKHGQAYGSYGD